MFGAVPRAALCLLLGVAMVHAPLGAQVRPGDPGRLQREEFEPLGAVDAYEIVQRLRPDWLRPRPAPGGVGGAVAVYVDGARVGLVESLRSISPETVGSMEFFEGSRIRERLSAASGEGVTGLIWISTQRLAAPGGTRESVGPITVTVTVYPFASPVATEAPDWGTSMLAEGWEASGPGPTHPASTLVGVRMQMSSPLTGEILVGREWGDRVERYTRAAGKVTERSNSLLVAALAGYGWRGLRLGVGPAVRMTRYEWVAGTCECTNPRHEQHRNAGLAASAALTLPPRGPLLVELRAQALRFSKTPLPAYAFATASETTGSQLLLTAGIGLRR